VLYIENGREHVSLPLPCLPRVGVSPARPLPLRHSAQLKQGREWASSASGQDVSVTLETAKGRPIEIGGETVLSTFMVMPPEAGGGMQLQQGLARYTWDGEAAIRMIERSNTADRIS